MDAVSSFPRLGMWVGGVGGDGRGREGEGEEGGGGVRMYKGVRESNVK